MQPDIWEELWRPACVVDMQPDMWSTRCRRTCVRSHAKRHTGCHQPEADWLLSLINIPQPSSFLQIQTCPKQLKNMGIKSTWPERKRERNKVVDLECSRFSLRRPVPSNRRSSTIVTRKLCPFESVQATQFL
ncbi:hypothetical protein YC2023_037110 [Brassica napus]